MVNNEHSELRRRYAEIVQRIELYEALLNSYKQELDSIKERLVECSKTNMRKC